MVLCFFYYYMTYIILHRGWCLKSVLADLSPATFVSLASVSQNQTSNPSRLKQNDSLQSEPSQITLNRIFVRQIESISGRRFEITFGEKDVSQCEQLQTHQSVLTV